MSSRAKHRAAFGDTFSAGVKLTESSLLRFPSGDWEVQGNEKVSMYVFVLGKKKRHT